MNRAEAIGTHVRESIAAPISANDTTCAIGRNILPSIPTSAMMGIYTIRMMICPKVAELIIRLADSNTCSSICFCESRFNSGLMVLALEYAVNDTIDNDNGAIDNKPEIDGSQAHQVA